MFAAVVRALGCDPIFHLGTWMPSWNYLQQCGCHLSRPVCFPTLKTLPLWVQATSFRISKAILLCARKERIPSNTDPGVSMEVATFKHDRRWTYARTTCRALQTTCGGFWSSDMLSCARIAVDVSVYVVRPGGSDVTPRACTCRWHLIRFS